MPETPQKPSNSSQNQPTPATTQQMSPKLPPRLPKLTQSLPKTSPRHPKGTQKASKRHPKGSPEPSQESSQKNHSNYSAPEHTKDAKRHQKSQKSAPPRHLSSIIFFQRIPTTFFVTFSRPPGCLDLLKHCACHAFRGISEILKFTFVNEKVL